MPMSGAVLAAAMKIAIDVKLAAKIGPPYSDLPPEFKNNFLDAIAEAVSETVVTHIQTTAVVNTAVAVVSVSAVTPGIGASGPGTGTGTGTIL